MNKEQKPEIVQNNIDVAPKSTDVAAPDIILNANEKIYLANIYTRHLCTSFVYMLVCRRQEHTNSYSATVEMDIATFGNNDHAYAYFQTVERIKSYQEKAMPQMIESLRKINADLIKNFEQNTNYKFALQRSR